MAISCLLNAVIFYMTSFCAGQTKRACCSAGDSDVVKFDPRNESFEEIEHLHVCETFDS